jgi:hypothetical protein
MSELKPCPFCGGEAEFDRKGTSRVSCIVKCTDCGCTLETGETWASGQSWNTRTQSQCDLYDELYKAALGLSHGVDWNNGTQAIEHGYRDKLLSAVIKLKEQGINPYTGEKVE